jgi:hypothetical protein
MCGGVQRDDFGVSVSRLECCTSEHFAILRN